jgi:hypothetical protein
MPLLPAAGAGLSSCLLQGRLASDGRSMVTSVFDVDALRAVEHAIAHKQSVMICPVDPLFPLPALIAAAAHVDAMVRERLASGRAAASPLRVAVVTRDFHLRGLYRGLAVRERQGVGGVPMRTIVPAATLGANGALSVIDREDGLWATAFVESVATAAKLGDLDLLVVDLPCPDSECLLMAGVPTVVVARDPADPVALKAAGRMAAFGYDWAISGADVFESVPGSAAQRVANRARAAVQVVPVDAASVCSNAGLFWSDVVSLVQLSRRAPFVRKLVAEAFGLFHDLLGLALPVEAYEQATGDSLERRIDALVRSARIVADRDLREDWLPMVEVELAGVLQAIRAAERGGNPGGVYATKAAVLAHVVADALDDGQDVLVVARTAGLARAYTEHLNSRWPTVRVASIGELADVRPADVAVLPGMAPTWGRWVYRSGIARELKVLAYADRSEVRRAGHASARANATFDEAVTVADAVSMQLVAGAAISTPKQRARAWTALSSQRSSDGGVGPSEMSTSADVEFRVPRPPEVPPGLWSGSGWTAPIEPEASTSPVVASRDQSELAPGFRVEFTDGTWTWFRENSIVWRWRPNSGRTEPVEARSLAVGHELVFIDDDAGKSLLGKVIEVFSAVPELAVASAWVGHWRECLARAYSRCGSYAGLRRALAELGCAVQDQTVRLWCLGETIGPDDRDDVRRVGELLDDRVLLTKLPDVWRAIRTLRGAHGRLKTRFASLARVSGPAAAQGRLRADEILDEASGLTAADIESAIVMVTVNRVERADAVPRLLVGRRRDPDEPVDLIRASDREEQQ